jgi:uncharacterized coiled-coil DUF342 family protein
VESFEKAIMSDGLTHQILAAINTLSGQFLDLRSDVTTMRADMTDMRADITGIRAEVTGIRSEVMARIDRLQDSITGMRDDIATNFARADRVNDRANGIERVVHDLGTEISAMQRQIQRLQSDVRALKGDP